MRETKQQTSKPLSLSSLSLSLSLSHNYQEPQQVNGSRSRRACIFKNGRSSRNDGVYGRRCVSCECLRSTLRPLKEEKGKVRRETGILCVCVCLFVSLLPHFLPDNNNNNINNNITINTIHTQRAKKRKRKRKRKRKGRSWKCILARGGGEERRLTKSASSS